MSSYSLQAYVLGLFAFMLIKVLAPGYFARHDMKTPVKVGMIAIGVGIAVKVIIVAPLNIYWQIGHVGLALATALAAYVNVGLLYRGLRKGNIYSPLPHWRRTWLRYCAANLLMVVALLVGSFYFNNWEDWGVLARVVHLAILCAGGGLAYIGGLLLMGFRLKDFRAPD